MTNHEEDAGVATAKDQPITFSIFKCLRDTGPRPFAKSWNEWSGILTRHEIRESKDGRLFSPCAYREGASRGAAGVEVVTAFVADVDDGAPFEALSGAWEKYAYAAYSTHSHTAEHPKYRVVFPLAAAIPAAAWPDAWPRLNACLLDNHADPATKDPSRIYFLPSCPPGSRESKFALVHTGQRLDINTLPPASPRPASIAATNDAFDARADLPPWWVEPVAQGARNQAAYSRSRWLTNQYEGNRCPEEAWRELEAWNAACCKPPLSADELASTFASAVKKGPDIRHAAPRHSEQPAPVRPTRRYPPPPDEAAYHGLAGEIVRVTEPHTEADPVAILAQVLMAFGSVIGRTAYFLAEADRHFANLFVVLVGVSSRGRKGTAWGHARRPFEQVDPEWCADRILSGLSSGEGLIWAVRDPVTRLQTDKASGELVPETLDAGITDKRLLAYESEFASVLKVLGREGNTLSALIRNAWDTGSIQTLTKNSPARATDAHISIHGHITDDELRRYLSDTEAGNGFANRILWICTKRSKVLPEGGNLDPRLLQPLICRLKSAVAFAKTVGEVKRDDDARADWKTAYESLTDAKPGLAGAVTSRAEAQTMRLAMVYALMDNSSVIRRDHLHAALALWEYVEDSARYIFGDSLGDVVADRILSELRANNLGLDRTAINALFKGHMSSARISDALALLLDKRLARCETIPTAGAAREVWFAA